MRRTILSKFAMIGAAALIAAACGGGDETVTEADTDTDAEASADEDADAGTDGDIAVVLKTLSNQFWATMQDGVDSAAEDSGATVTVQAATGEDDAEEQSTLLQTLIGNDNACFAVAPITGTNLVQPLTVAQEAGRPIVNLDSAIDAEAAEAAGIDIATFIASNNEDAGAQAGTYMAEQLGGSGEVAVVGGIAGDANSNARTGGFIRAAEAGGLTVVQEVVANWDREEALNAADNILDGNPELGGFYAANDGMALGIVQALQNRGIDDVVVIGTDGNQDAIESIVAGGLTATMSQYPYAIGELGVSACRALIAGESVPEQVDAPVVLVDNSNAEAALESFPLPFEDYDDPFAALLGE